MTLLALSSPRQRQQGAVALLFLLTLVITLGGLLMALDYGRLQMAQARLQQSLDAGVDAAVRQLGASARHGSDDWHAILAPWLAEAYPAGFANSELNSDQPSLDLTSERLVAQASGKLRLLSAGLLDLTTASFSAHRVVPFSTANLDVVIAIDTTQLSANPANDLLRQTALQLAEDILRHSGNRVAIVPFSDTLNVGKDDPEDWLDERWKDQIWFNDIWKGCVAEIGMGSLDMHGNWIAQPAIPNGLPMGWRATKRVAPLMIRSEHSVLIAGESEDNNLVLHFSSGQGGGKGPTPNMLLSNMRFTEDLTASSNTILRYNFQNQSDGAILLNYTLLGSSNSCLDENAIIPFQSSYASLESRLQLLRPETNTSHGLLPLGLLWAWRTSKSTLAPPGSREQALVVISTGENAPTPPGKSVQSEKLENLSVALAVDALFCPGYAGGHTDKCKPDHKHSGVKTGRLTITSRASDNRQSVSSMNTDGASLTSTLQQTKAADLDIYTRHLCQQLNALASPNDLPVYWMIPQSSTVPPELVTQCTEGDPDRFEPFTAANYPTAVRKLVGRMMAK